MWKVKNDRNNSALYAYNTRVIVPFFKLWLSVSREPDLAEKLAEDDFWEEYLQTYPIINSRFLNNNKTKANKVKPLLAKIVLLGFTAIKTEWKLYLQQNRQIYAGNYNIPKENHQAPITKFFKDYLYDYYWGLDWVWTIVAGINYSRATFHNNFKKENKLTICPYCDVDTIAATRNSSVEHFLPKDHFPLIACNPRNLIPCCTACNMGNSGKGTEYRSPVYSQFNRQIGDDIQFKFNGIEIDILHHNDPATENYLGLLQLRKRYKETAIQTAVINRFTINYNMQRQIDGLVDKANFLRYVREIGRDSGHYFVQRDLLDQANVIILPTRL